MATVAFNQFVNPWALDAISWWYYTVYCGWLVVELVFIYFFIVETKGAFFFSHHERELSDNSLTYFRADAGGNRCSIRRRTK